MKRYWFILSVLLSWLVAAPAFAAISVNITAPKSYSIAQDDNVLITADAASDDGITKVEFFVDNVSVGVDETSPYSITWNTSVTIPNKYAIKAVATDSADAESSDEVTVYLIHGLEKALVIDLGSDNYSGSIIETELLSFGIQADRKDAVTSENIADYPLVFVCLGYRPDNHVLTEAENAVLTSYLDKGGMLYMEGGDTWSYDPQFSVHGYFGIQGIDDGTNDLASLQGSSGTFAQGSFIPTSGTAAYVDHLQPENGAVAFLENINPAYTVCIYREHAQYFTVGCSVEIGNMDSLEAMTQVMTDTLVFASRSLVERSEGTSALPAILNLLL